MSATNERQRINATNQGEQPLLLKARTVSRGRQGWDTLAEEWVSLSGLTFRTTEIETA